MDFFITTVLPNLGFFTIVGGLLLLLFRKALDVVAAAAPKYFEAKAKNLADKEDIAAITKEVEGVRSDFAAKTEQLRSDLQLHNQLRHSIRTEERNAIVDCYEKYHSWVNMLTGINGVTMDEAGLAEMKEARSAIEVAYRQVQMAESKMILYVGAGSYTKLFHELKLKTLLLSGKTSEMAMEYISALELYFIKSESLTKSNQGDKRPELIRNTGNEVRQLIQEYRTKMYEDYKEIVSMEAKWRDECFKKLTASYN